MFVRTPAAKSSLLFFTLISIISFGSFSFAQDAQELPKIRESHKNQDFPEGVEVLDTRSRKEIRDYRAFYLSGDIYGSHTNLMPYRGYQDDISGTLYGRFRDFKLMPFVRGLSTKYHYLLPATNVFANDHRTAFGVGLDYKFNESFRVRITSDQIHNELSDTSYTQDSYGIIYNQYIPFTYFDVNNYLESFYIPRFSTKTADTFFRLQLLKAYYLSYDKNASNAIYPFMQVKAKSNDDAIFGVSGHNASVGAGYKIYVSSEGKRNGFSILLELNSIFYQSEKYEGDWVQSLAALQWMFN